MLHILLIDDSENDRLLAMRELSREFPDVHVEQITNSQELAQALKSAVYDVAITDYQLIWTDGITVLKTLKHHYPDRPVVMFTSSGSQEIAVEAMKSGLDDYVLKSAKYYSRLATAVRLAVERAQERRKSANLQIRLHYLLNRLDLGVFRATLDGKLLEANAAFLQMFGIKTFADAQEFYLNIVFPHSQQYIQYSELSPEQIFNWKGQLHRADGSTIWLNWSKTLVLTDTEFVIDGLVENITERQRIEAARRESEERFRLMADTAPILLWLSDVDKRCYFFNKTWLTFTGRSLEAELGDGWTQGVHPDDLQYCLGTYIAAFDQRQEFKMEYRLKRYDGEYRWVLDCGVPRYAPDGSFMGYIGSAIDITARKRSEQALQLLAQAGAVLSSSLDYETTLLNVAELTVPALADWCILDMLEKDGSIRRFAVIHQDIAKAQWALELQQRYPIDPQATRGVANVLRTQKSEFYPIITDKQLMTVAYDAEHLEILRQLGLKSVIIVPLSARGQTLGTLTLITSDSGQIYNAIDLSIAEELGRRAALAIYNGQLYLRAQDDRTNAETASRLKDEFLATLSHELRTPLNAILGWSQMLLKQAPKNSSFKSALETIVRNAKAQTQIVEDVLDVSQIIGGQLRLQVTPVDLAPIVEKVLESLRPAIAAKEIHVDIKLDQTSGKVSGDATRLQQIFWNLLSNAVKFTQKQGEIRVQLHQVNTEAQITVQDNGIGISPEFLPFVFDRFRQADSSITRSYGGLGLGLALVRYLTELHGGTVDAMSLGIGQGATFTVKLPLMVEKSAPNNFSHAANSPISDDMQIHDQPQTEELLLANLRILVVDDEDDTRELLVFILEQYGAQAIACASAAEAIETIRHSQFDVFLFDIGMPLEDGYILLQKVRALPDEQIKSTPAIALTAYAAKEDQQKAVTAGFQSHLAKPVEPEELVAAIANIIVGNRE